MKKKVLVFLSLVGLWGFSVSNEKVIGAYYVSDNWGTERLKVANIDYATYNFIFQAFLKADTSGKLILAPERYPFPNLVNLAHQKQSKVIMDQ
jgi:hypothetical protein